MTAEELEAVMSAVGVVTREAIDRATAPLLARVAALEARPPARDGRDGLPGVPGPPGATGAGGPAGEPGARGEAGARGEKGDTGDPGAPGREGEQGARGEVGARGEQGARGDRGEPGAPGRDGEAGAAGKDGRDAIVTGLRIEADGDRDIVYRDAEGRELGRTTHEIPQYRGVFSEGTAYAPGDCVTYGGSVWINRDATDAIRPDEHTAAGRQAWTLMVKRGREGKEGKTGPSGPAGPRGDAPATYGRGR